MPTQQTDSQRAATFQAAGLNYTQQQAVTQGIQLASPGAMSGTNAPSTPTPPSQRMDAGKIADNATNTGVQFPPTVPDAGASAASAASHNASIPSPDSIIQGETAQTPAEQQNDSLLQKLAKAIGSKTSFSTLQTQQETSSNVPALTSSLNDLQTQQEGLTNQATALQNDAGNYGAIQNKERLNESGGNVEAAMHGRPLTKDALLQNQIQQSAIASQSLTLKSAIYAAQGKLSLAKDAADKSAQVQFDAEQQQIDYMNALIDANKPQMTKEEKAQADLVTAKLADRQNLIDNAKQDKVTGIGLAAAAMKNNPSDSTAQYNAQQVLKLDPSDPNYLQKVSQLVGKYQQDPNDVALKIAQIQASRASTASSLASAAKTRLETQQLKDTASGTNLQQFVQTTAKGAPFVNTDSISDAATKKAVQTAARSQGITVLDKAGAAKLQAIDDTRTNLTNIKQSFDQFAYPNATSRNTVGLLGYGKQIKSFLQTDDNISSFKSWRTAAINSIQALAGGSGSGLRINQAEIDAAIHNDIPDISDTSTTGAKKIENLTKQLDSWETEITKPTGTETQVQKTNVSEPSDTSKGSVWNRPDGKFVSDGTQWVKQ